MTEMSINLDPEQKGVMLGPDLGPNYLLKVYQQATQANKELKNDTAVSCFIFQGLLINPK